MNRDQIKKLLKRIQSNYPNFIVDDYKISEWHKELKNYDEDDVHKKLEEHMRSSEYGNSEPKLYFLTKFLKTKEEKNKVEKYRLQCTICGKFIPEDEYNEHFERCLDVDYIIRKRKELFDEDTSEELKQRYYSFSQETFDDKYLDFLNKIYKYVDIAEQKRIDKIMESYALRGKDV